MKKKIVVPVDFSMTSLNAYVYARELAKVYNARIDVVHIHQSNFHSKDPLITKSEKSAKEVLRERLEDFVKLYPADQDSDVITKVSVKTRLIYGFPVKSIVNTSKEDLVTMVVMGSTGESDMMDRIIGRVSSEVAQRAYCPVLLVPKNVKYAKYNNILYSSNYESADQGMLDRVLNFNKFFGAALHFIHINNKNNNKQFDPVENKIFDKLFENGDPSFSFNLASVQSRSVLKGLLQYVDENNIDLIVMVNRQRGFFESMFGDSLTKKVALRTHVPILAYHARYTTK